MKVKNDSCFLTRAFHLFAVLCNKNFISTLYNMANKFTLKNFQLALIVREIVKDKMSDTNIFVSDKCNYLSDNVRCPAVISIPVCIFLTFFDDRQLFAALMASYFSKDYNYSYYKITLINWNFCVINSFVHKWGMIRWHKF